MKRNVLYIQYLRGIAAMLVVLHHARNPQPWLFDPLANVSYLGGAGVDIFFVISGFIMFIAARNEAVGDFIQRRLTRIVPLYWLATLLLLVITIVRSDPIAEAPPSHVIESLLFIPHFSPSRPGEILPLLIPGWTLNFEMFFYAVFAIAIISGRIIWTTASLICGLVLLGFILQPHGAISSTYTDPVLLEFLAGVMIGKAFLIYPFHRLWLLLPIGIAAFILVALPGFPQDWRAVVHGIPAVIIVIGVLAVEARGHLLQSRVLKLIGDASYSIYLSHGFTLIFVFAAWRRIPLHGWPQFVGMTGSALAAAALVGIAGHLMVEKPLLQRLNHFIQGLHRVRLATD